MSTIKRALVLTLAVSMLAMLFAACDRNITRIEQVQEPSNCFDCHSDQNLFLVAAAEQWENSVHASSLNIDRGASSGCAKCHASEGFIQFATGESVTGHDNPSPIHCFACHAPHTEGDFGLRWTQNAELQDGTSFDLGAGNLCAVCHQARRDVNTYVGPNVTLSTHWGPHHSTQGDMLIGANGYEYDNYTYNQTNHRGAAEDGCLDCHFKATSNSVVGGHAFNMAFTLRDEGGEEDLVLNTDACEPCHGDVDDFNIGTPPIQDRIDQLATMLEGMLDTAGLWHDGHPVSGFSTSADSAGALWNYLMVVEDRSMGVHNPDWAVDLLSSSIEYLGGTVPPPPPAYAAIKE